MTARPAWASDPATLELIVHEALRAGDVKGCVYALRLMATCDARRAQELLDIVNLGLDIASAARP